MLRRIALLLVVAHLGAAPPAGPTAAKPDEQVAKVEAFYKSLKMSPITLNKKVFRQGDVIVAKASVSNPSGRDLDCPQFDPDGDGQLKGTIGWERWRMRRLPESFYSMPYNGEIHDMDKVRAGQSIDFTAESMRIDVSQHRLEAGEWELLVHLSCDYHLSRHLKKENFRGPSLTQVVRFTILDNPPPLRTVTPLSLGKLVLSAASARQGATIDVTCELTDLTPPGEKPDPDRWKKHSAQWSIGQVGAKQPPMVFGGRTLLSQTFAAAKAGVAPISTQVATSLLAPGNHEVILEIRDSTGAVVDSRKATLRVSR